MKKQEEQKDDNKKNEVSHNEAKTKTNTYTAQENQFADGEGTKLDKAIDSDGTNPATRGE